MFNDRVARVAFFVSLSGHLLFFALPGLNLDTSRKPEDIKIVLRTEIPPLLPEIKVIGDEKKLCELQMIDYYKLEETVSNKQLAIDDIEIIDSREEAMLRYQDMIRQRIEANRRFPRWAKERRFEGTVHLSFVVSADGRVRDINVVRSSGFNILDNEAISTVKRASPFPPIPPTLGLSRLIIEVAIVFML